MKIPSSEAAIISEKYGHEVVVIAGYDGSSLELASFGTRPMAKDMAADWADKIPAALDFNANRTMNEDYRATSAAVYKHRIDVMEKKLKEVDQILRDIAFHVPTVTTLDQVRVADVEEIFKLKRMAVDALRALAENS